MFGMWTSWKRNIQVLTALRGKDDGRRCGKEGDMKGYKGMNADMTCRGMPYEVGKNYHVDGYIKPCERGLHFCEKLIDVFDFYERENHRFFEVEASGEIKTYGSKSAASDLLIIRELSDIEINRIVYGYGNGDGYGYGYGYGNIQKILLFA